DIFALGAVLYEMATGRPAFTGKSRASLISAIMSADPAPISTTQPLAPPALDRVVRSCLAKDPDERWQTAHDVGLQLKWIAEGGSAAGVPAPIAMRRRSRERLAWASFAVAAAGVAALSAALLLRRTEPPAVVKFTVPSGPAMLRVDSPRISPDGRYIAVNAADSSGNTMLWLHAMGAMDFLPIPGTTNATRPSWSPDSRYVGFVADGKVKKVAVTGGPPQTICDAPTGSDGSWGTRGVIVFDGRSSDPIRRVSAAGGQATAAVKSDSGI